MTTIARLNGSQGILIAAVIGMVETFCQAQATEGLPEGVRAVWDLDRAWRETTPTRERMCINGLWQWQPAEPASDSIPSTNWGYFKVPGPWPGITDYMQKDSQTVHAHPSWKGRRLSDVAAAWYQRSIAIPATWSGRRITLQVEYLNSYASVYVDGKAAGNLRFPSGELNLTPVCRPGATHVLSLLVAAMPLKGLQLSYTDSNAAREVKGSVARRGLCGDVYLAATPAGARIADVRVDTSVREDRIAVAAALEALEPDAQYALRARVSEQGRTVKEFLSQPFQASGLRDRRIAWGDNWRPDNLWDTHTPGNQFELGVSLLDARGGVLDATPAVRFGFREFWIDGRDFYLNGSRIFLSAVPLDNAQIGAALATYDSALETMKRLSSFGINFVYTHNYNCQPGSHLSFAQILQAADDAGMLVSLSQPHFSDYDWRTPDADQTNGYARDAQFYVRAAQNHPSVVMYSMSHNATGYNEDMDPDRIDGIHGERSESSMNNVRRAVRAEAIVRGLDPGRIVYHHSSGNLGAMHTSNFYPNFVPIQELCDWFEHWATQGVKPFFACEYGAPFTWDWAMYRGWFKGAREFGSAAVPWDFSLAEWNAQFLGDAAFRISEQEKRNIRWEAGQFRQGRLWHRWDYPHQLGSSDFDERYPILARYLTDNWRAFRTWGVSAISPWEHGVCWKLRPGIERNRRTDRKTDWDDLQRPGFSPDYIQERYERMDIAYERGDWIPTPAADALYRNNRPLLAYIAGKPARFTSKDHNFLPGETVEKQIVVINNSRMPIRCDCEWSFAGGHASIAPPPSSANRVRIETGQQARIPLTIPLLNSMPAGVYELAMTARFRSVDPSADAAVETQEDRFTIHVLPPAASAKLASSIALFDPRGETARILRSLGIRFQPVEAGADLSSYDLLIAGKGALSAEASAPDLRRVPDGLKVLVFEQTKDALERRLGFRVQEYGLRTVFPRIPGHPVLGGLGAAHLCDWRGEATILPPRLDCVPSRQYNGAPSVRWCGLEVPRLWRCGNQGNVASVLIEKPARGDFLPILDGGFSLQYSPLLEYRQGRGMILFCQMDVTGRTEDDPAAGRLCNNILAYVSSWKPGPGRQAIYAGDPRGRAHFESMGFQLETYAGRPLTPDQVLVVGSGGGAALAPHASEVSRWIDAGGHLLALELDAREANPSLPTAIRTVNQEHIAACFEPAGPGSLLAGIGPADVHNRAPRELPLVTAGARIVGNGVLAQMENANVVFCQIAPASVSGAQGALLEQHNLRRTYRRTSFLATRLLANMGAGAATPLLSRFAMPVGGAARQSVLRNGDFRRTAAAPAMPDQWIFSAAAQQAACALEAAGPANDLRCVRITCPEIHEKNRGSVMLAQHDVPVKAGQWYRIALRAKASGLGRARVTLALQNMANWQSLFEYQNFVPSEAWSEHVFLVQANATLPSGTRFQIWHGTPGTLWLADVRMAPCDPPSEGRWTTGLYADQPQEWDDPYRFFRW
ncbi:MAG TPA: glycoside hydrolase family 2 TIM barrel-domain containing protein [Candidatus Paceibacterota bacterium]|nr:glycoside hydrolase family 2 TIM barrel-domain containing protein [Verrucomicrobiota bacterium]HRZ44081.1 glycoside hydrolase family 2 TIM barrel-domain containing protein [Candidatus Paceibacterota bacterium]